MKDTRRVATRSEVGNWELVTQLATKRLVVTGRNEATGEETVEVIHETLILQWQRLREWVDKERDLRLQVQKVEEARRKWQEEGKKRQYLLEGRSLKAAKRLLKKRSNVITEDVRSFVRESLLWRRVQLAGLLIPLLAVVPLSEHYLREEVVKQDYARIKNDSTSQQEKKIAVVNLAGGCWAKDKFSQVLPYFRERLFGNCRTLQGVNLEKAALQGTNLSGADLSNANLSGADLSKANLSGANLDNVIGKGADLNNADLSKATFKSADLSEANLMGVKSESAVFNDANLSSTNFGVAKLMDSSFFRANLSGANLGFANLSKALLAQANLSKANLFNSNLSSASLGRADLSGASLFNTNLQDTSLGGANLQGAGLVKANLRNSSLLSANLNETDLSGSDLSNILFQCEVRVSEHQKTENICPTMKNVKWDKNTKWSSIKNWQSIQNIAPDLKRLLQGIPIIKTNTHSPRQIITFAQKNTLLIGEKLVPFRDNGDRLTSINRCFNLVLQEDGNLVLYNNKINKKIWASNTDGKAVKYALFSKQGNLELHGYGNEEIVLRINNNINENTNSREMRLVLQNDGNVVIYKSSFTDQIISATNTSDPLYNQIERCSIDY